MNLCGLLAFADPSSLDRKFLPALSRRMSVLIVVMAVQALSFPADAQKVVRVAAGGFHNLELREDGTVWAWGRNLEGQLGEN